MFQFKLKIFFASASLSLSYLRNGEVCGMLLLQREGQVVSASRNLILGHLMPADRALIGPHLTLVDFNEGQIVYQAGELIQSVYFPENIVVALDEGIGSVPEIEIGLIGYEGLIGWSVLLGCSHSVHRATVEMHGGFARCMDARTLLMACRISPTLLTSLLAFVQSITFQMAHAIVAHVGSSLDRRIARWLLMRHDRVGGDQLFVRHDQIAADLDARRASITNRLHILEGEKLIINKRGKIVIQNRQGLESYSGSSYGKCEESYSNSIAPFGKSRTSQHR